jgi:hypothetical protein
VFAQPFNASEFSEDHHVTICEPDLASFKRFWWFWAWHDVEVSFWLLRGDSSMTGNAI